MSGDHKVQVPYLGLWSNNGVYDRDGSIFVWDLKRNRRYSSSVGKAARENGFDKLNGAEIECLREQGVQANVNSIEELYEPMESKIGEFLKVLNEPAGEVSLSFDALRWMYLQRIRTSWGKPKVLEVAKPEIDGWHVSELEFREWMKKKGLTENFIIPLAFQHGLLSDSDVKAFIGNRKWHKVDLNDRNTREFICCDHPMASVKKSTTKCGIAAKVDIYIVPLGPRMCLIGHDSTIDESLKVVDDNFVGDVNDVLIQSSVECVYMHRETEIPLLTLRPIQKSDTPMLMSLRNGADTFKWFYSNRQFTLQEVENWIENLDPNKDIVLMAEENGVLIGTASVYNIEDHKAEVGRIIVSENIRGKGIGTSILLLLPAIAKEKGLGLLYANIKIDNVRSYRAFEKAGYTRITTKPETGYYYELKL